MPGPWGWTGNTSAIAYVHTFPRHLAKPRSERSHQEQQRLHQQFQQEQNHQVQLELRPLQDRGQPEECPVQQAEPSPSGKPSEVPRDHKTSPELSMLKVFQRLLGRRLGQALDLSVRRQHKPRTVPQDLPIQLPPDKEWRFPVWFSVRFQVKRAVENQLAFHLQHRHYLQGLGRKRFTILSRTACGLPALSWHKSRQMKRRHLLFYHRGQFVVSATYPSL